MSVRVKSSPFDSSDVPSAFAMSTVTVSHKGQVVMPVEIRKLLGIGRGTRMSFTVEGQSLRVEVVRKAAPTRLEDGYGMLVCRKPGERHLAEFDVPATTDEAAQ